MSFRQDELERFESYRRLFVQLVPSDHDAGLRQPLDWDAGAIVDDLELAGEYPNTVLIITFGRSARPECPTPLHEFLWVWSDVPRMPPQLVDIR